jgi:DMSO/TMAO reductase YedYZ molybdopterin-dependent catalytic subunit
MYPLDRRAFLATLPALSPLAQLFAQEVVKEKRIVRSTDPLCLEFPFAELSSFLTPKELHYIRNHYPVPAVNADAYKLQILGAVKKPRTFTLNELLKLKATTMPVTLECAGNNRLSLTPKVKGVQWAQGAVSTAEWTGPSLATLLDLCGVADDAVDVIFDSIDKGDPKKDGQPPAPLSFARSIPIAKAMKPEVLLAYNMYGKPLPANHGFPLRAIVGGWYGMASVKWVSRIIVTTKAFLGFDQTLDYAYWVKGEDGLPRLAPITTMQPKASIVFPQANATLTANKPVRVYGAAWAGESDVATVEISTDNGKTWAAAKLLGKAVPFCWRLWEFSWTPAAGAAVLMARATDTKKKVQPMTHAGGRRTYMISKVDPIPVMVK